MPGMTNCLVGSSQEKYSFASGYLYENASGFTFDETTILTKIRTGLSQLAVGYGAKFYGLTQADAKYVWTEYTAETLPVKISYENNILSLVLGTNDDVLITAGRYSGFPLFKCEFTKKFGVAQIELATKEGSTNVILLAVTGGNIVNNGVETSPFITMAFAD